MKTALRRTVLLLIVLSLVMGFANPVTALSKDELEKSVFAAAEYMINTVKNPQVGSIGGEWAVIGLARSGYEVPDGYYENYYATVENYVKACKGVLHEKKYTEYSRIIVALSSIGKDARDVAGYDLTYALGDYDKTIWQGLNGPIWALIALDTKDYPIPENKEAKTQATRQKYIDRILECQLKDGGWNLFGGSSIAAAQDEISDPDITGMALQALAKYQDQPKVAKATKEALACMSGKQGSSGSFDSWGTTNSESCVQMLVALCELGIPLDDSRFAKNGVTLLDNLKTYQLENGSFLHTYSGSGSNQMASEQGLYGVVAALRAIEGKNSLYRMSDAITVEGSIDITVKKGEGLEGKHKDVLPMPITAPGTTFEDITFSPNIAAIEALASRGIINGRSKKSFAPDADMTRAEFATIITRGLGLVEEDTKVFSDVSSDKWYAGYIGTANKYGIVNGIGEGKFNPEGTITRQEAATMVARAAALCGLDTKMSNAEIRDVLSQFEDYVTVADWAMESMAFCYKKDILSDSALKVEPKVQIQRSEIAQMLFNMLTVANLL
ncbi:MAG: Endo-1,4-beta-xylanase A precursor [Firmicutes bacterium ADurb.Bin099]|nr:MAG: Endo-1,4-beta-xylanase A precursor [Firmicutes bacterium ADurb.Bin099]HPY99081.1 S-layer homology domain-containing protein [Clostridia bacterium]HQC69087.1 S-layer homology domain-containing protein [Clostridia bacterium]